MLEYIKVFLLATIAALLTALWVAGPLMTKSSDHWDDYSYSDDRDDGDWSYRKDSYGTDRDWKSDDWSYDEDWTDIRPKAVAGEGLLGPSSLGHWPLF
jgi:hypothetical protein